MPDLRVALTLAERELIAFTISDAVASRDTEAAARLIEARCETLIRNRLAPLVTLVREWEQIAVDSEDDPCPDDTCGTCTIGQSASWLWDVLEEGSE